MKSLIIVAMLFSAIASQAVPAAQVTGIGGVFFKAKGDAKALTAWYQTHLGIKIETWGGAAMRWADDPRAAKGTTAWMIAPKDPADSPQDFMIDYRVDDLAALAAKLQNEGIQVTGQQSTALGKFGYINDPEGNKIELWEPAQ